MFVGPRLDLRRLTERGKETGKIRTKGKRSVCRKEYYSERGSLCRGRLATVPSAKDAPLAIFLFLLEHSFFLFLFCSFSSTRVNIILGGPYSCFVHFFSLLCGYSSGREHEMRFVHACVTATDPPIRVCCFKLFGSSKGFI